VVKVFDLAETQITDFERNLRRVIDRFQAEIIKNAKSGYLFSLNAEDRVKYAPDLYDGILKALHASGYDKAVADLINRDAELISEIKAMRSAAKLPTTFAKSSSDVINAFKNMEMAQFSQIGTGFANSLSQELMNYAITGVDESVFIEAIRDRLESGFKRYARTYAITSRAKFIQQVQDEAAKNYDGELYWEYVGPEDDRMRDACIDGMAQRYFTDAERAAFEAETADERAWNCRHTFQQITEEDYRDATGSEGKAEREHEKANQEKETFMGNLDADTRSAFDDLGITAATTEAEINQTFRGLAKLFHPDKGGTDKQMRIIIEAREKAINYVNTINKKRGK
jgi:hypothetical protein